MKNIVTVTIRVVPRSVKDVESMALFGGDERNATLVAKETESVEAFEERVTSEIETLGQRDFGLGT